MGRVLHADEIIADTAARQRGLVTREQLYAAGVTGRGIDHRLATGRLHRVHRNVYLVGHAVMLPLAQEQAALLACGAGATLSHRSAVRVWALLPPQSCAQVVDVTIAGRRGLSHDGIVIHRPRLLEPVDTTHVQGLALTTVARTLLDFAEVARMRQLERAWHEAIARGLVSVRAMQALLARSPGRRGARPVGALLRAASRPGLSRSGAEELMLALVRSAGFPDPEMNVVVGPYRVDFVWREARVIVEIDGGDWHALRPSRERDSRRDSDLRSAGWKVERFTDRELVDEPHGVVARLARALAS